MGIYAFSIRVINATISPIDKAFVVQPYTIMPIFRRLTSIFLLYHFGQYSGLQQGISSVKKYSDFDWIFRKMSYNDFDGGLTQRSECYFHIVEVVGSNPISPTRNRAVNKNHTWGCSSVGERSVRIREVEGSTPFISTRKFCRKLVVSKNDATAFLFLFVYS